MNVRNVIRWAGGSAMVAGIFYVVVGIFHPLETLTTVTTTQWAVVHLLAVALSFFGLFGIAGLYARQVEETGWLGLVGFVLLSLWLVLLVPFTFAEVFILPQLASASPVYAESFLGIFNKQPGEMDLGVINTLWVVDGVVYILGGLLFGIATLRAGILPRWAAGLLVVAAAVTPLGDLFPLEYKALVALPVGVALAWLGYALWSERRAQVAAPDPGTAISQVHHTSA